ncbi:MAG: glycosyltransferase family 4 protein [Deltaproteobacteria bacterium]|nr:glycosyltransferase family 4 protein [Deltaproteobacteria bacterium]
MRILFTWHAAVEPEYRKLFKEIAAQGNELTVITPEKWFESGRLQEIKGVLEQDGYKVIPVPILFQNKLKRFLYRDIKKLAGLFRSVNPEIVHIFEEPYSLSCFQMAMLSRRITPGAKIVVESFENMIMPQNFLFSYLEKFVLRNTDTLIAIPEEGRKIWSSKGFAKKIAQAPVGLDENLFKRTEVSLKGCEFPDRKERARICYVGRLTHDKGVDLLIEAIANLREEKVNCELVIAGSGEKETFLRIAREKGVSGLITFIDALESRLLPALYSKADILVLPSRTTKGWKEQFGRVLTEAMSCEVAVVGSDSGEIPHVIGNAGLVFREGDPIALTEALRKLIQDKGLRESYAKAGRERVLKRFTWKSVAQRLTEIYKEGLE